MKTLFTGLLAIILCAGLNAQTPDSLSQDKKTDTTNFTIGKKNITIIENSGETDVKISEGDKGKEKLGEDSMGSGIENYTEDLAEEKNTLKNKHFKGHWDAFQIGINSYMGSNGSTALPDNVDFMSLNTNKSINVNINFCQQSFGITRHFGLVSGLGFEFSNYAFDGNNTIVKENGNIVSSDPGVGNLKKSKLSTTYFTVPLLVEVQLPGEKRSNRLFINAGVIGGIKLESHTKIKYLVNGDKQTKKNKDDFNINALRYGFTGRIGIKNISLYGTYYPVALFEKSKDPELYPFMVGFSFDGF